MPDNRKISLPLMLLGLGGLFVSVLAGLNEVWPSAGAGILCPSACKETAEIVLLHIPVWAWGVLFWAAVFFLGWFRKESVPWLAAPAAGMEAALIWIMLRMGVPCVFCILNAVVVLVFLAFSLRKRLIWQQFAIALLFLMVSIAWIPHENRLFAKTGPPSQCGESGIVARVGDEVITDKRLEVLAGARVIEMKKEIYRLKREKLEQQITDMLLNREADQQGKTVEQLLDEVVPPGSFTATEQDVDKYIQDNREHLTNWTPQMMPELRSRVKAFLENRQRSQKIREYVNGLESKYKVKVCLAEPEIPLVKIPLEGTPSIGPANAPVTVIEFADYECPACRGANKTVEKVRTVYSDKVRWYFKDYPLRQHKHALKAAEAAHCAGDYGKFWEYQNLAFTRDKLDPEDLVKYATELGIPADAFRACLDSDKYKKIVDQNMRDGISGGVDRTPSFIINGQMLTGALSFDAFKAKIEDELKKAEKK